MQRHSTMADTLILNSDASPLSLLPLSTVTWQEAIKYVCMNRVSVLEWYEDWVISSPTWETRVPAVMILRDYIRTNTVPRFSKSNLTLRDEYSCQYCGIDMYYNQRDVITLDHVIPQSMGGITCWDNIVASCKKCNQNKGSKLIKPRKPAHRPSYYELVKKRKKFPITVSHPSWESYL